MDVPLSSLPFPLESHVVEPDKKKIFRDYAWAYFSLHAGQRLQSFNFFLIVAGLLAGGTMTLLKDGGDLRWIAVPLGVTLALLSGVFWKLEHRTRYLIKNAEKALKYLDSQEGFEEKQEVPHVLRLFDHDDHAVKGRVGHVSYSWCLSAVFLIFAAIGILLAIVGFFYR
jgi:hypothetical protein